MKTSTITKRRELNTAWDLGRLLNAMKFIAQVPDTPEGDKLVDDIIDRYTTSHYYENIYYDGFGVSDTTNDYTNTMGGYIYSDPSEEE